MTKLAGKIPEKFTLLHREHLLFRMGKAIRRWNIKSNRNINYRSFAPIIKLAGEQIQTNFDRLSHHLIMKRSWSYP